MLKWLGRQKNQGHEDEDKPGGPLCPGQHRGSWHPRESNVGGWHGIYEADDLQAPQVILRHNQVGQALERDQKPIAFQGKIAMSHLGIADVSQMLLLLKGMNLLTMKHYASLLLISPTNKAYTYCCKSPVPNSGWYIKEVLSFDLKVFHPAGNITTWSSSAVLSGWSQW